MKVVRLLLLVLGAAWSLEAAAALTLAPWKGALPDGGPGGKRPRIPALLPLEAEIIRNPFAPKSRREDLRSSIARHIAHRHLLSLLPAPDAGRLSDVAGAGMGWALPDRTYWQRIPSAAQQIPKDWSGLPVVRFPNAELGGIREIRLRAGPEYDQWLLKDPLHGLTACISVQRITHRVYFMEIARKQDGSWHLQPSQDNCYSCHPSGPRVIRPLEEAHVDPATLARFNRRILAYGACDFGSSVDPALRGEPVTDTRCTGCHDDVRRGKLYAINARAIHFKMDLEDSMPPK
ncbi:MAG TPA: hypothetical protein VFA07_01035 [Chthonomonadaceae bacterium]|nr:hypothetical protein [Chthonomonadaceae bacterium]